MKIHRQIKVKRATTVQTFQDGKLLPVLITKTKLKLLFYLSISPPPSISLIMLPVFIFIGILHGFSGSSSRRSLFANPPHPVVDTHANVYTNTTERKDKKKREKIYNNHTKKNALQRLFPLSFFGVEEKEKRLRWHLRIIQLLLKTHDYLLPFLFRGSSSKSN